MKFKTDVKTGVVNNTDLLDLDSIRVWMGDTDYFEYNGFFDAYRRSVLRLKVNLWLATQTDEELSNGHMFAMTFYFGVFYRPLAVLKVI